MKDNIENIGNDGEIPKEYKQYQDQSLETKVKNLETELKNLKGILKTMTIEFGEKIQVSNLAQINSLQAIQELSKLADTLKTNVEELLQKNGTLEIKIGKLTSDVETIKKENADLKMEIKELDSKVNELQKKDTQKNQTTQTFRFNNSENPRPTGNVDQELEKVRREMDRKLKNFLQF